MADMRELEIEIDLSTGEVTMDAIGFRGKACEELTEKFAQALGGQSITTIDKPEKNEHVLELDNTRLMNYIANSNRF